MNDNKYTESEIHIRGTFAEKLDHFWFYYKWHTLIALFVAFVLIVCISQSCTKQENDVNVLYAGPYMYSDAEKYGGTDVKNPRIKQSRKEECDGREDSIRITVPPMGISVFSCTKAEPVQSQNEILKEKKQKEENKAASSASKSAKPAARKKQNTKQSLKDKLAGEALQEENRI